MSVSPPGKAAPPLMPLTGAAKAALLLLALGKGRAAKILRRFDAEDLQQLSKTALTLRPMPLTDLDNLIEEFAQRFATGLNFIGSVKDVKGLLADAIASEPAQAAAEAAPTEVPVWEIVAKQQPEILQLYLLKEHPQTIAVILSKIGSEPAAAIIGTLPAQLRNTLLARMLNIKSIEPGALQVVEATLREDFAAGASGGGCLLGHRQYPQSPRQEPMRRGPQELCRNAARRRQSSEAAAIHVCRAVDAAGQGPWCPVRSGAD